MIKLRSKMPNSETSEPASAKWRCRTRNCFVFLALHVQPCQRGRLPAPARLQGLKLVEGLVHLSAEVRLVAAYRLEVGLVKKHPLSALLEDLRLDFLCRTFEAYHLVARLGMDDLKELLLGPDDATVHGPRFGRYPSFAGEPLHEALQLPHRELHVVEKSIVGYAWQGIQQLLGPVSDVPLLSVLYTRVIVGHLDRFPCGQVQEGAAVTPLYANAYLGLIEKVANVLVQRAGHLEIVEDVGGVGFYEHAQRVGVLTLVDGLYPSFVQPLGPQVLYDVLLALLEPLGLVEHHPVQAPAHERHALR